MPRVALLLGAALAVATPAAAQSPRLAVGAHAVLARTQASPVPFDSSIAEIRLVQPMVMLRASAGPWRLAATADFEGWTMPGGQLAPGSWGEGFNDRRHPHTYLHELMASFVARPGRGVVASLSAGKGFAPYGSDDPMGRPALLYPVNHHWSQILERAVLIAGVRRGPLTLEAGLMNGDEPERPSSMPLARRFGDSWSLRALVRPRPDLELQLSRASLRSPEYRYPPARVRHEKWSASLRVGSGGAASRGYGLLEWARTSELDGIFVYTSLLAEAELRRGRHRPHVRVERTDRPEEERQLDPFRSTRPHAEETNLGISRWLVGTAGYGVAAWRHARGGVRVEPIAEVSLAHVTMVTRGTLFTPQGHFGGNDLITFTVGLRIGAGAPLHRIGRYGVLAEPDVTPSPGTHHE
jgi:hypothetical protein